MTASPDPAAALAAHVAQARFQDLPEATVEATKRDLLDSLACALGGSGAAGIPELTKLVRHWGGREEVGLLLVGGRLPAPAAAMVHGAMGHALDFDDTFDRGGSIHPGVSVFAACLATADMIGGVPGRDVSCRIALAATVDRGWHRTAAIGVFGATAVAGKLLGLSAAQLHHALGIAYSQAAGNRQCIVDGALTKRLQAGQAASTAITAALLARDGFTGANGIFAGKFGFFELYQPNGYDLAPLTAELGTAWRGDAISFKPYPCGRPQHAAIDAAIALHDALGLDDAAAIEDVTVTGNAAMIAENFAGAAHKRAPTQIVQAQFALPFLLAIGLLRGRVAIADVADFADPQLRALAARIRGEPGTGPLRITARRTDGRVATREAAIPLGAPENPLSAAQRAAKLRDCAAHAVRPLAADVVDRAHDFVAALETQPDATALTRLLA
jgi:2-methylcitrate dehydratase PrpD